MPNSDKIKCSDKTKSIAIVYFSANGSTRQLAEAFASGIHSIHSSELNEQTQITGMHHSVKVHVQLHEIRGHDIHQGRYNNTAVFDALTKADAIVFGAPTYMGSLAAQFKAFMDASNKIWAKKLWRNKFAAGFTIGSCYSGDQQVSLQCLNTFACQHGMIWLSNDLLGFGEEPAPNRLGAQSGLVAQTDWADAHPDDLRTAEYFGRRIASLIG